MKVAVIGLGNMGGAFVEGLLKNDIDKSYELYLYDQHEEKRSYYDSSRVTMLNELKDTPKNIDYLVLCVKPHDLPKLNITKILHKDIKIVSVLAGVKINDIRSVLNVSAKVVRVMPNIPALIGMAASVLCPSKEVEQCEKDVVEDLFNAIGDVYWAEEKHMDAVTGLSGSGPAYIYMVIEALTDGGVKMGLPRNIAAPLAVQTVMGAAAMVKETGIHPAVLKDQVTTPAGTTISALAELEERGLRSMFLNAVQKATERSEKLGENQSKK